MKRKRIVWFGLGLLGAYTLGCFLLANRFVSPAGAKIECPDKLRVEQVDRNLTAWTSGEVSRAPVVYIFAHGYRGNLLQWKRAMEDIAKDGNAGVTFPMPGHSNSSDSVCTLGPSEAKTIQKVSRWVRSKNPAARTVLVGVSMGGAACWLAVNNDPGIADAVITESAFARLSDAVDRWFSRSLPGGQFFLAPVAWIASGKAGINIPSVNPLEGAQRWHGKKSIIIHPIDDATVPYGQGEMLALAAGTEVRLVDAPHSQGYELNHDRYLAWLREAAQP